MGCRSQSLGGGAEQMGVLSREDPGSAEYGRLSKYLRNGRRVSLEAFICSFSEDVSLQVKFLS